MAVLLLGSQAQVVFAADTGAAMESTGVEPEFKPPIDSSLQSSNSEQAPPPGLPTALAPLSTDAAQGAVKADFAEHKNKLSGQPHSMPPQPPTGAAKTGIVPVLSPPQPSASGPAAALSTVSSGEEEIKLGGPPLKALVSVNDYLNPFSLDSSNSQSISLRDALRLGLDQNHDLAVSRTVTKQRQFAYYSSLGNFLPDPTFGFNDYMADGKVALPGSLFSAGLPSGLKPSTGGSTVLRIDQPFLIMHGGIQYNAYRGGSILFGALQAQHNYKAGREQEKAVLSDTLVSITQNYYNLVLAEALLQIRIQAVRTSEELLRRNTDRFESGLATNLDILQSKTQLARDRQALVDQQIARRSAAIALATSINADLGSDFLPVEHIVRKVRLIDPRLTVSDLLQVAINNRAELKQYEELRLAAKRAIIVAGAPLQPTVALNANMYGIGPPSKVEGLFVFAVNANWKLKGFGEVDSMAVQQARWQARQTSLQSQKELQTVLGQVRNSILQSLDKERNIDESSAEVSSAVEELRLAELRKANGLGTNIDVITAQRDYTQALIDKAQALINFNIAQAQLLHDVGLTSVDALSSGRLLSNSR
jgi:outer membrane protein TolC